MDNIIAKLEPRNSLNTSGAITLPANYQEQSGNKRGEDIFLLTSGQVKRKALNRGENPGDIRFSTISMVSLITGTGDTGLDSSVIKFWKNHPDVRDEVRAEQDPEYAEKSNNRLFSLLVMGEYKETKRQGNEAFHQASSIIYQMEPVQRREVLFYFNENTLGMDDTDVTNLLLDPKTGKVTDKKFVSEFLSKFSSTVKDGTGTFVAMVTNLHKGVMHGLVQHKNEKFYLDGELLGKTSDDAVQHFRNNPKDYTNLVKALALKGDEGAKLDQEVKKVVDNSEETAFTPALDLDALKTKAHEKYKIKGAMSFKNIDSLVKKMNEFEIKNDLELTVV